MGKKSKRKGSTNAEGEAGKTSSDSPFIPSNSRSDDYLSPPPGVSCWICLDEKNDEQGHPLIRDCSCRGDSGFGHISCIIKYAEAKSREADFRKNFKAAWTVCHCCHQDYRGQLSVTMADAMISFAVKTYPEDPFANLLAPMIKMAAVGNLELDQMSPKLLKESTDAGLKVISMVGHMRSQNPSLPGYVLMFESNAYLCLGQTAGIAKKGTKERSKALTYFEKYRDTAKAIGDDYGVKDAEAHILEEKSQLGLLQMDINVLRDAYKNRIKESGGEDSSGVIIDGTRLALELHVQGSVIEAERLLAKIIAMCRRVHGRNHQDTKFAESHLRKVKVRKVALKSLPGQLYQFLGYTDSSKNSCSVKGPLATKAQQKKSAEQTMTVETKLLVPTPGTPVVCHGLIKASHLNGKIGEIRRLDAKSRRLEVHFEEKSFKPCLVKEENVHILLEVADLEMASFTSLSI